MAYRPRRRKATKHRRRVGAVGKRREGITRTLALVGGAVGTAFIQKELSGKMNPKVLAGLTVAAGYLLPTFIKGEMMAGFGDGMMAAGGVTLLQQFGVLNGIPILAGWGELPAVAGVPVKDLPDRDTQPDYVPSGMAHMYNSAYSQHRDR